MNYISHTRGIIPLFVSVTGELFVFIAAQAFGELYVSANGVWFYYSVSM